MIWIEMSKDEIHGGGEWGFSECLWSPVYKRGESRSSWLFWKNILHVKHGDVIIHLRGKGHAASFVGYSIASTDGHETMERPPEAGEWSYATSYFRVILEGYRDFQEAIKLDDFISLHRDELLAYLKEFSVTPTNRFFVYQSNRLQCLNGAYLSKCDEKLLTLILDNGSISNTTSVIATTSTTEVLRAVRQRVGQTQFAEAVKTNYKHKCCFPGCQINDPKFLVGSHIARWVDNPGKRGNISNGLCFCVLHDKAFENGFFSFDNDYRILLSNDITIQSSIVFIKDIAPFAHKAINSAEIIPDKASLAEHRFRCKITY